MKKLRILMLNLFITLILCTGCTKDIKLDSYKEIKQELKDIILTDNSELKGIREFGENHYTGTYEVEYKDFNDTEVLFGGISIKEDKKNIHIKIKIEGFQGEINIISRINDEKEILAAKNGSYEFNFDIKNGINYLAIKGENYSGKIKIEIE